MDQRPWTPPFSIYHAEREQVCSRAYRQDARQGGVRRLLIKHTLEGEGVLYVKGRRLRVPAGHLFVIDRPCPCVYAYEGDGQPWAFEFVSIRYGMLRPILPAELALDPVLDLRQAPGLLGPLRTLIDLGVNPAGSGSLQASALAYRFFLDYVAARRSLGPAVSPVALALRAELEARLEHPVSVGALATELGYTHAALTRLFCAAFGLAPSQYLLALRLQRAGRLLEAGILPIKAVAQRCGFPDANYFGRVFRAKIGLTPAHYRRHPDSLRLEQMLGPGAENSPH